MKTTYAIIGRAPENKQITEWSKEILTSNKWNYSEPEKYLEAPYSYLSGAKHITLLFAGTVDDKTLDEVVQIGDQTKTKLALLESATHEVIKKYKILPFSLEVQDMVCFGDSHNCIVLKLDSKAHPVKQFHDDLMQAVNKLNIFPKITDHFPFTVHITLGYKRMDPKTFAEFEDEILRAKEASKSEKEKNELSSILTQVKNTPVSQMTLHLKKQLISLGCSSEKLEAFQKSLMVTQEELSKLKEDFMRRSFCKSGITVHSIACTSRSAESPQTEKTLFTVESELPLTFQLEALKKTDLDFVERVTDGIILKL